MADDVIEALAKLKPAAVNRDAILFAAGRATAKRSPIWKWLSFGLIATNLLLLRVWLTPEKLPGPIPIPALAEENFELSKPEVPSVPFDRSATLWNLEAESTQPVPTASVVPEEHWTARTPIRFD